MGIIIALIIGGVAGWLASIIMGRNSQMGIPLNILVGIVGAFIGNWIVSMFGGGASITRLSLSGLLTAVLGAVVLLGIINLFTRKTVR